MNRFFPRRSLLLLVLPLFLSGCWNMKEISHMYYAYTVGVDYKQNEYQVYVQILDFSTLGKQESAGPKGGSTEGVWIGKGAGPSFQAALYKLYASSQRKIYWGHLNTVVLSQSMLDRGFSDVLDELTRYNELRYTLWMFGTHDPVESILLASPIFESSPVYSELGDPRDVYEQYSYLHPKRLLDLTLESMEPGKTAYLPMLTLSKGTWFDKKQRYNALEIDGISIVHAGKSTASFHNKDLSGVRWMDRDTERAPLLVQIDKHPVATVVIGKPKPRIITRVNGEQLSIQLKVKLEGSITEMTGAEKLPMIKKRAEQMIAEEIRKTYLAGIKQKVDILNLLDPLYRKNPHEFNRLMKAREYPLKPGSLKSIEVDLFLSNTGRSTTPYPNDHSD